MEKEASKGNKKAHVLVVPYPAQGHVNPMLQFCKRLIPKGIKISLANWVHLSKSISTDPNNPIKVEIISDGHDEGGFAQAESDESYLETLSVVGSKTLANLIQKLIDSDQPVTAVIYDGFIPWALDVAKQFGLVGVVFFTQTCAVNNIYYHVHRKLLSLPLTEPIISIPGLPPLKPSDTPSYVHAYGAYPGFSHTVFNQFINVDDADWILFSTFYELEAEVSICSRVMKLFLTKDFLMQKN
ncbi:hypothetical protein RJ641_029931 [Dillenia turbinata]|uniref:Uncharacterized protein n=1 Tax=Dillenia turbinata TaxID=194707 RepID=A0AAN8VUC6_9MAGN